jgi:FAD/FMN-containing dehydrogenase
MLTLSGEESSQPWNRAVEQPVVAVAEPADVDETVAVLRYARERGLGIATQAGGHGATGRTEGSILLRTTKLNNLTVDPVARRARVDAGVTAGQVQAAAASHGLTALAGSSPIVSVAGLALGGGLSWFSRRHGWVADSIITMEVIDADGCSRRVDPAADPDLFWALRGAGGDFAVVTALELALFPAPRLYGGRAWWPGEHSPQVADAYRRLTAVAPDELSAWLHLAQFPGAPPMVAMDVTYLGDQADARDLLAPLDQLPHPQSDTRQPMSPADIGSITAEPTNPGVRLPRAELLTELTGDTIATLLAEPIAPLLTVQLRHLAGALARPSDSPHGALTEPYLLSMLGVPSGGVTAEAIAAAQHKLAAALPVSGRKPVTFLEPTETAAAAFAPGVLARLRDLKHRYDPSNLFRSNFPIADDDVATRSTGDVDRHIQDPDDGIPNRRHISP